MRRRRSRRPRRAPRRRHRRLPRHRHAAIARSAARASSRCVAVSSVSAACCVEPTRRAAARTPGHRRAHARTTSDNAMPNHRTAARPEPGTRRRPACKDADDAHPRGDDFPEADDACCSREGRARTHRRACGRRRGHALPRPGPARPVGHGSSTLRANRLAPSASAEPGARGLVTSQQGRNNWLRADGFVIGSSVRPSRSRSLDVHRHTEGACQHGARLALNLLAVIGASPLAACSGPCSACGPSWPAPGVIYLEQRALQPPINAATRCTLRPWAWRRQAESALPGAAMLFDTHA